MRIHSWAAIALVALLSIRDCIEFARDNCLQQLRPRPVVPRYRAESCRARLSATLQMSTRPPRSSTVRSPQLSPTSSSASTSIRRRIPHSMAAARSMLSSPVMPAVSPAPRIHTTSLNPNTYLSQIADAPIGATVTLAPNTKYWIIADAKGTFDGAWEYNPINDFGPVAGRSNNGPWNLQNANDPRLVFQVEGRTIPEPATATIVGIGLAASLCLRRTRIRRHA